MRRAWRRRGRARGCAGGFGGGVGRRGRSGKLGLAQLLAQPRFDVSELLDVADRHLPELVFGLDGCDVALAGALETSQVAPRGPQRGLQLRKSQPARRATLAQALVDVARAGVDLARIHRVAPARQLGAGARQVIEQFIRRDIHAAVTGAAVVVGAWFGQPARVAIGLEGAPGDVVAVGFPDRQPRLEHGVAEVQPALQQLLVQGLSEQPGVLVVHRPAGHHHAAHADVDQLARHAGGELVALPAEVDLPEVAAVEEHELGHHLHRADLGRGDEQPVRQHHAAAPPAVGVQQVVDAVGRDVQDAPRLAVQRREHVAGRLIVADHLLDPVAHAAEQRDHGLGLQLRTGQRRRVFGRPRASRRECRREAFHRRVADDQRGARDRLSHRAAERGRRQLADHRGAQRQRALVVVATGRVVGQHQFPRQVGRGAVDHQHHPVELAGGVLEVVRHHQLEQHAAEIGLPQLDVDLLAHQLLDQPRLALLHHRFGARALSDVEETQAVGHRRGRGRLGRLVAQVAAAAAHWLVAPGRALAFAAVGIGHHQARPVAAAVRVEQALPHAFALLELAAADQRRALQFGLGRQPRRQVAQCVHRGDGGVQIDLDDVQPRDPDVQPGGLEKARVGLHHAVYQGLDRGRHRQIGR